MRGTSNVSIITASLFFTPFVQHKRNPALKALRVEEPFNCHRQLTSFLHITKTIRPRPVMGRKGENLTTHWSFASITKGDYEPRLSRGLTNTFKWELLEIIIRDNEKKSKMCTAFTQAEERPVGQKIRKKFPFHFARVLFSLGSRRPKSGEVREKNITPNSSVS